MANPTKKLGTKGEWVCTDPDTKQYGRQLSEKVFEFKQEGTETATIDLDTHSMKDIENSILPFGYTLDISRKKKTNVFMEYGEDAYWIIAECIFENNL